MKSRLLPFARLLLPLAVLMSCACSDPKPGDAPSAPGSLPTDSGPLVSKTAEVGRAARAARPCLFELETRAPPLSRVIQRPQFGLPLATLHHPEEFKQLITPLQRRQAF